VDRRLVVRFGQERKRGEFSQKKTFDLALDEERITETTRGARVNGGLPAARNEKGGGEGTCDEKKKRGLQREAAQTPISTHIRLGAKKELNTPLEWDG